MIDYRVLVTSQQHRPTVDFWRRQLAVAVADADRRPRARGGTRSERVVPLTGAALAAIDAVGSDPLGRFAALTAAIAVAIHRYFGDGTVVLRTPVLAGEPDQTLNPEREVPLVLQLRRDTRIREVLARTASVLEDGYSFQDFPVTTMLREEHARELSETSRCSVSCAGVHDARSFVHAPLHVQWDGDARLLLECDETFETFVVDGFAALLLLAIEALRDRDAVLGGIARIPAAQRDQVLHQWNRTGVPGLPSTPVHVLFERLAARMPDAPALRCGDATLTYEALNRAANRVAQRLLRSSGPAAIVAIWMDRSPAMVAAVLGALKAGCAYLPIDADCPASRMAFIARDARAALLLVDRARAVPVGDLACEVVAIESWLETPGSGDANPGTTVAPGDLAYILYTSGSSGEPKGCAVEHHSLANYVAWAAAHYWPGVEGGTMALFTPLSFDLTITSLFCPLVRGRTLHVFPQSAAVETILRECVSPKSGIDTIKLTPSHVRVLEALRLPGSSIRCAIVGGETLTRRHVEILRRLSPGIRIFNEYGPTEATVGCIVKEIPADACSDPIPIGRPIANMRAYVLDDALAPVAIGVRGEICVSGDGVARGYHGQPLLTDARFAAHPFLPGERLYRTGDLGRWLPSGEIECFGRLDRQVKVRGHRVELGEVEASLRACPGIGEAVVVAEERDEGTDLVAYVVTQSAIDPGALLASLSTVLPDYMLPSTIVRCETLPLTANGKLDRARLPDRNEARAEIRYRAPRGREEQALVRIWREIFRLDAVGVDEDFFELGGHSLRAMKLVMLVHQELGVELSLNDVFRSPTIAKLAAVVRRAAPSPLAPIRPVPDAPDYPVSHGQKRLWILDQVEEEAATYNVSSAFELTGRIDVAALERAFAGLVARHESLRTTFVLVDGEPRQRVSPAAGSALRVIDASMSADPDRRARELAASDVRTAFDLEHGPLLRATLVVLGETRCVLALTLHHIVIDEWSFRVLIEDLVELYRRERDGARAPLPPLPIQYRDFAAWQHALLASAAAERHRRYWLETLGGDLPPLALPLDFPRPAVKANAGARYRFALDAAATSRLRALGAAHGASLFIVLVAAVKVLLHRSARQDEVRVGIPIAGRRHIELADQVGFYLNTLVLRDRFSGSDGFDAVLETVARTATEAYEHDVYPFDRLVEELGGVREHGRLRLFDVMVVQGDTSPLRLQLDDLAVSAFDLPVDVSKFDLSFQFDEVDDGLVVELQYDTELFLPERIRRMRAQFESLVALLLDDPRAPVGSLPIAPAPDAPAMPALPDGSAVVAPFVAPSTPEEVVLAAIWRDVLGLAAIGVHDNFFELGGDSIIALQIVSRAGAAGLHLSLRQMFRHPTIAGLAALGEAGGAASLALEDPSGPVPLTPIQRWFVALDWPQPSHFNQAMLLETPRGLDPSLLRQAIDAVCTCHEVFRLRASRGNAGWSAAIDMTGEVPHLEVEPLRPDEVSRRCSEIQSTLDLSAGPLARFVFFDAGPGAAGRLFLVAHHFAIDGVSWRVLLEDFGRAYRQLEQGEPVALPPRTLPLRSWSRRLLEWADAPDVKADVGYWVRSAGSPVALPVDMVASPADHRNDSEEHVSVVLEPPVTAALLAQVPRAYNTQMNDVLLAALAMALTQWAGGPVRVDLEGHGRQAPVGDVDVSRTLGWFTSVAPLTLPAASSDRPEAALKDVKEALRAIPSSGMSYGLLRYLARDPASRAAMEALPEAAVRFNYLGQSDQVFDGAAWRLAPEPTGASHDPAGARPYLLDIVAIVTGGRLEIDCSYSKVVHHRETVVRVVEAFRNALDAIVAHCTTPGAGALTPSDVPGATIGQAALDRLVARATAGAGKAAVADVYDLTPVQQGMLFHSALDEGSGVYVEQSVFAIAGSLDAERLREAWRRVCARHAALRTAFFWRDLDQPVQLVFARVDVPWDALDWQSLPDEERRRRLDALLDEDRRTGLPLERAPLMRCRLIRVAADRHTLVWTTHHIVMDGWSRAIVLQDVLREYEGMPASAQPLPFSRYIEWQKQQDGGAAGAYWLQRLAGFRSPTALPPGRGDGTSRGVVTQEVEVEAAVARELTACARRYRLTLSTLVSAAWALTLADAARTQDVVFGTTISGRPPALDGAESMVGLFINTLPLRVTLDPETPVLAWLRGLQAQQLDVDQFSASALVDVQRWSDVPRGRPLFESVLVFENYPVGRAIETAAGPRIEAVDVFEQTNYPLTVIAAPDEALTLRLVCDRARYDEQDARGLASQIQSWLDRLARDAEQPLGTLVRFVDEKTPTAAEQVTVVAVVATAPLSPALVVGLRAVAADSGVPLRATLQAVARIQHARYAALEDVACTVDGVASNRDLVASAGTFACLLAAGAPASDGAVAGPPDVTFAFVEEGNDVTLVVASPSGHFDEAFLWRAHGHFAQLAAHATRDPASPFSRLSVLTAEESRTLLDVFNDTAREWGRERTIVQMFEEQVAQTPDAIAVCVPAIGRADLDADAAWTYAELNAHANALARRLVRDHGVGPDVLVGVMAERSLEMVLALVAILKAGGAYVPLDPDYPRERVEFMVADSGVRVVITTERFRTAVEAFGVTALCVDAADVDVATDLPSRVSGDSLAYMIYTSGSTGRPKGALNTHRAIANRLLWMQDAYGLTADDRVLQKTPFSFDVSVWEFFWPLMTGASLVMAMPGGHGDSRYLVDLIDTARISTLHFVPSMLHAFLDEPQIRRCAGIRRVICSGEALPLEVVRRFESRLGVPLFNLYGPTEAAVDVTAWPCRSDDVQSVVPIGKPIANTQMYILDAALQPMPLGCAGELFIGGVNVGRGYLNRPELTGERFIQDPFSTTPGARMYRTGDLARYRADGNIEYLGRLDHQVKLRGFRIELGEIEATLLAHDGVRECVVIVREDQPDMKQLVAYVVPRDGHAPSSAALRRFAGESLPHYMVPSVVVSLGALPKLPNGKLDRRSLPAPQALREQRGQPLRRRAAEAAPPQASPAAVRSSRYVPPRTEIERALTLVWQEVLGVDRIGVTDDYFELGGHSILALRLMSRIQSELGRTLPLAQLFANPTIEALAASLGSGEWEWPVVVPIRRGGDRAPLFLLPGAGGNLLYFYSLAHALPDARPVYGLQAIGLDGATPPLESVTAVAERNLDELRRVQPEGPYFIAGHSFGGKVAFEMSQQLRARGEEVGLLAILDTAAPIVPAAPATAGWQDAHWLVKIAREIEEFFGISLAVTLDDLLPLSLEQQLDLVIERMRSAGWWAPGADRTPLLGFLQVYKANSQAEYVRADVVDRVPIALFKALDAGLESEPTPDALRAVMQEPSWGWDRFSVGGPRVVEVPGDHLSMLAEPNVRTLAEALGTALDAR